MPAIPAYPVATATPLMPAVCRHHNIWETEGTALHGSPLLGRLPLLGTAYTCVADFLWVVLWFNMVRVEAMFPSAKPNPAFPPHLSSLTEPEEQAGLVGYMYNHL